MKSYKLLRKNGILSSIKSTVLNIIYKLEKKLHARLHQQINQMVDKWTKIGIKTILEKQLVPAPIPNITVNTQFIAPQEIIRKFNNMKVSMAKTIIATTNIENNTISFNSKYVRKRNMEWMDKIIVPHEVAHLMQYLVFVCQNHDKPRNVKVEALKMQPHGELWQNILMNMGSHHILPLTVRSDVK